MFRSLQFVIAVGCLLASISCRNSGVDLKGQFPTPEPAPWSTPLPNINFKTDFELEKQIAKISEEAKGKVGAAAVLLETGDAAMLNSDQHFPMQSVYKLPIAMAIMEQVKRDELNLDEKIGVTKADFVRTGMRSPLRDANQNGGEFTVRELIRLSLVESDGTASDVLMRIAGGSAEIRSYLSLLGIQDIKVVNTEKEIGSNWQTQYENWSTPIAAVELLRSLCSAASENPSINGCKALVPIDEPNQHFEKMQGFLFEMANSVPGAKRLKSLMPKGTVVAHKTGTGGTQNGITGATNDIGIIFLPNGNHLAIAVFVSDSPADEKTREAVIAKIAKACWDKWTKNH